MYILLECVHVRVIASNCVCVRLHVRARVRVRVCVNVCVCVLRLRSMFVIPSAKRWFTEGQIS